MGKGSKVRPHNKKKFDESFDRIFHKKKPLDCYGVNPHRGEKGKVD